MRLSSAAKRAELRRYPPATQSGSSDLNGGGISLSLSRLLFPPPWLTNNQKKASNLITIDIQLCFYQKIKKRQGRYELNFTRQDTSFIWFLCKQEASLLDITDRACALFSRSEVALLEWTDDLEVFILKGYGKSLNYKMGVPLLQDVVQSMEEAIKAKEEKQVEGSYEKARLRFAHAEAVVPFSCLLGLFLEGSEFQQIQQEKPLQLPRKPPRKRIWKGSNIAPFAGNNMLVLYSCLANSSSKYFVQVLHNEVPRPLPGCDDSDFCPFEVFKERIVAPHLNHDYNAVCNVEPGK